MSPATSTTTGTKGSTGTEGETGTATGTTDKTAGTSADTDSNTAAAAAAGAAETAIPAPGAGTAGRPPRGPHPERPRAPHRVLRRVTDIVLGTATRTAAIIALLALWEAAPRVGLADRTFLPPFSEVAVAWWELLLDGELAEHARISLARSAAGFGLAVAITVPLGLLIGWYRPLANLLGPLLEVFRNTAPLALLPVFVLLLGIGETSKISIVLYACAWPILLNTISAVRNVDPTLFKLARSMDLSAPRLFQKVVLPASVPTVFTGIRLAGAAAILVLVAAEMVGAKAGLGYLINASQYNFAIPEMYAGIITISAIGVGFNQLLVVLERRITSWRAPAGN